MALIPCPDCGKQVSDQARACPTCGCPVAVRVAQMRQEEEERIAAVAAQQERQASRQVILFIGLGIAAFILLAFISSCISNASRSPTVNTLYEMDGQTQSIAPGINPFSASGTLTLTYSCQISSGKSASVQFVLEDLSTSAIVWKKSIRCSGNGLHAGSDTLHVKADNYDVGATVTGDAAWTMRITQK